MKKLIRKIDKLLEEDENLNYWLTKTPHERLHALQVLREQYIYLFNKQELYNESRKRLRRFYKITKQKKS